MEGNRFFDLVRWGVTDQVMNDFYAGEKTKRTYYQEAFFDKNKEEYCPIPLKQINFSQGLYKQNPGY
ncbi:SusD family protein [compost metagenome]